MSEQDLERLCKSLRSDLDAAYSLILSLRAENSHRTLEMASLREKCQILEKSLKNIVLCEYLSPDTHDRAKIAITEAQNALGLIGKGAT